MTAILLIPHQLQTIDMTLKTNVAINFPQVAFNSNNESNGSNQHHPSQPVQLVVARQ